MLIYYRKLIFLAFLSAFTPANADYLFINIGAGDNGNITGASIPWDDANGIGCTLTVGYRRSIFKNLDLGARWLHVSQCDQGPPFNDNPESSLDHIGVFLEYRIDI